MLTIKSLAGFDIATIHAAFAASFADYNEPVTLSVQELQYMIERRGFQDKLSFGAFDGERLIGFILNGIGNWNNRTTVYDTGTGVIGEYRQQGIAARMLDHALPVLRSSGIKCYLLEVIKTNTKAFDLYRKAGFSVTREFDYFFAKKDQIVVEHRDLAADIAIYPLEQFDWKRFQTFWDFSPSWQNSIAAIERKRDFFKVLGLFKQGELAGYGIIERHTGDIPQVAIRPNLRRQGMATRLIDHLLRHCEAPAVKLINVGIESLATREFARRLRFTPGYGQYEMEKQIG